MTGTTRDWPAWLQANLDFPFLAVRIEDEDDAYFTDVADREPFRLGHRMQVLGLDPIPDSELGLLAWVSEGGQRGRVPLASVEALATTPRNREALREYVVWFSCLTGPPGK